MLSPHIASLHQQYLHFVRSASVEELQKLWGIKKIDEFEKIRESSLQAHTMRAIECYSGVAYEALDFASLDKREQDFVLESVLIFSNLFGVVRAGEILPFYKLKQGEGFEGVSTKAIYQKSQDQIDLLCGDDLIVDLRAEFYQKLYVPKAHYVTFEFLKDGKKISHYAKYYRGLVLREIAKHQSVDEIWKYLSDLTFLGFQDKKNCTKLVFSL